MEEEGYTEEMDELDFYSEDLIEKLLEEDELSVNEAGFMRGYDNTEEII
jgi:hypothetical protein